MRPRASKPYAYRPVAWALGTAILAIGVAAFAQLQPDGSKGPLAPATRGSDTLHLKTKLGSFKLLRKGPDAPPTGTMTITFKGTVLISGIEGSGSVIPSGKITREFYDAKHNKQVWFGDGKLVVSGKFHNLEWFGRDLDATFKGDGVFRLYGEFADDKTTGDYWFTGGGKLPWLPSGSYVPVPDEQRIQAPIDPKGTPKVVQPKGSGT
jgi:hypothetical protein